MFWKSKSLRTKRLWLLALLLIAVAIVSGCRTLGYYGQAIKGQYQIVAREQPIVEVIADTNTPPNLKQQLELVETLCAFARTNLQLPADGHYRNYADLHRPYVVWNVQAASPFSLQPKTWWYPFVGGLEYRGYFSERGALDCSNHLRLEGYEVYVDGVEAYSTLGWFKDPVLNTFVFSSEPELAETLFHELGHQRVFVSGDTDFNEAYATTVGQEGARRWLTAKGDTNLLARYAAALKRNEQFVQLILKTRLRLEDIYGDTVDKDGKVRAAEKPPAPPDELRKEKQQAFDELREEYTQLKSEWGGFAGYDNWFGRELNNAQLNTVANYYDYLPGFKRLLDLNGGDLEKYYEAVERLGKLSKEDRHQRLRELAEESPRE
jgi:predicted aminopeptidase